MAKKTEVTHRDTHREYKDLLKDHRWLRFADGVKARHEGGCQVCGENEPLELHHLGYRKGAMPWEYEDHEILMVCATCHKNIHVFADQLWNEALRAKNQWVIYECTKMVRRLIKAHQVDPEDIPQP